LLKKQPSNERPTFQRYGQVRRRRGKHPRPSLLTLLGQFLALGGSISVSVPARQAPKKKIQFRIVRFAPVSEWRRHDEDLVMLLDEENSH